MPCLSVVGIEVESARRREGRARKALVILRHAASERRHNLIVENVVSPHLHVLIDELGGEPILGSRSGAKGCHYWLPPRPQATWQELSLPIFWQRELCSNLNPFSLIVYTSSPGGKMFYQKSKIIVNHLVSLLFLIKDD